MKKFLLTVVATAGIATLAIAESPVSFTVRAGLNINSLYGDGVKGEEFGSKVGFNVGGLLGYGFTDMWGLQAGLLLNTRGAQGKEDDVKYGYSIYELQVPVFFTGTFAINDDLKVKANVGPTFGIGLAGKHFITVDGKDYTKEEGNENIYKKADGVEKAAFKRFNFGIAAGAGVEFRSIYLGVGYDLGLSNLNNYDSDSKYAVKTGSFTINVAYTF
jgi:hypothetical protein